MATASILLDRSRTLKGTKLHPVCIRVTHARKQWAIGMKLYATEQDFTKAMSVGSLNAKQKELRDAIQENRTKAQNILDALPVITLHTFKQQFFSSIDLHTVMNNVDITTHFKAYIQEMYEDDRIMTAQWYEASLKALIAFRGNTDLTDIDVEYCKKFSVWMNKKGNSKATTQCYLAKLKTVFNRAIKQGAVHAKYYPFNEYKIGTSVQSKKALYPDEVKKLWEWKPVCG
jgi:integrase/recombinase XerD